MANKNFAKQTRARSSRGFTLLELLIAMGVAFILLSFTTINLAKTQRTTYNVTTVDKLIADLRGQQAKAMSGTTTGTTPSSYGIHIESSQYILFTGAVYNSSDNTNFPVPTEGSTLSSTFPNGTIIFQALSGEITGFSLPNNTITIHSLGGSEQQTMTVNRYGVVDGIN